MQSINNLIVILASKSISRHKLLLQCSIEHKQVSPMLIEEPFTEGVASEFAISLAEQKAANLVSEFPSAFIIGSDQILLYNGVALSKPKSKAEAMTQLQTLQGRKHTLHTGLACIYRGKTYKDQVESTMYMRELNTTEIYNYVQQQDTNIACGGYLYEQLGLTLFEKVETEDPSSILGLPCAKLIEILANLGFSPLL